MASGQFGRPWEWPMSREESVRRLLHIMNRECEDKECEIQKHRRQKAQCPACRRRSREEKRRRIREERRRLDEAKAAGATSQSESTSHSMRRLCLCLTSGSDNEEAVQSQLETPAKTTTRPHEIREIMNLFMTSPQADCTCAEMAQAAFADTELVTGFHLQPAVPESTAAAEAESGIVWIYEIKQEDTPYHSAKEDAPEPDHSVLHRIPTPQRSSLTMRRSSDNRLSIGRPIEGLAAPEPESLPETHWTPRVGKGPLENFAAEDTQVGSRKSIGLEIRHSDAGLPRRGVTPQRGEPSLDLFSDREASEQSLGAASSASITRLEEAQTSAAFETSCCGQLQLQPPTPSSASRPRDEPSSSRASLGKPQRFRAFSSAVAALGRTISKAFAPVETAGGHFLESAGRFVGAERERDEAVATASSCDDSDSASCDEEPVRKWRLAVRSLEPQMFNDGKARADLEELRQILRVVASQGSQSTESTRYGDRPILVTAPHSLYVLRDDNPAHLRELHTAEIAASIACGFDATCLRWSGSQQRSSELLWALSKSLRAEGRDEKEGFLLDPRVRDPNFLGESELQADPWHQEVCAIAKEWTRSQVSFHIDVHGCQDPPTSPSHLTVGLGAMFQQAQRAPDPLIAKRQAEIFAEALQAELPHVVAGLVPFKKHVSPLVRVILSRESSKEAEAHQRFSGAWLDESGRYTQSQQAVLFAGFTHSVQLEMSKVLRLALVKDGQNALRFSNALRAAWAKAKSTTALECTYVDVAG